MGLTFRFAEKKDIASIIELIKALAEYEELADEAVATEALLEEWLFEKRAAEVVLAELDQQVIGYALFFTSFSTFLGKAGLYLEDLFILPAYRHQGYGKTLFRNIKSIAESRDYGRMEWACLDWNQSAIDFYEKQGAKPLSDWTTYRIRLEG